MADPTSTHSKTSGPQRASAHEGRSSSGTGPYLSVRYWKRMRPNKIYPVVVSSTGKGESAPVTLRLVFPGAQVVPVEQSIDPSNKGEKATFYVTPLAKGNLRGDRLEVLQDGKKVQELNLPCKVGTQRPTLVWLFLALFIPWLLLHYLVYSPIGYQAPLNGDGTEFYDPKNLPADEFVRSLKKKEAYDTDHGKDAEAKKQFDKEFAKAGAEAKKQLEKKTPKAIPPAPPSPPSERITDFVKHNTPDFAGLLDKDSAAIYDTMVVTFPAKLYTEMVLGYHDMDHRVHQPIAFYVFLFCVFMAFVSLVWCQERRKIVYGRPLAN